MRLAALTLFALGVVVVLGFGWQNGEPWTASAFVVFFVSRVWRWTIKHPANGTAGRDRTLDAHRFLYITAGGWIGSAAVAIGAAFSGEGQEWLWVAPGFLFFGLLHLWLASYRRDV